MHAFATLLRPVDHSDGDRVVYRIPLVLARDLQVGDRVVGGGEYRVAMAQRAPGFCWTPKSNETYCPDAVYIVFEDQDGRLSIGCFDPEHVSYSPAEEISRVKVKEAA